MKHTKQLIVIGLAVLTLLSFAGCDVLLGSLVGGRVVNVISSGEEQSYYKTSDGSATLAGAKITLTNIDDPNETSSTSVTEDGSYSLGGLTAGNYRITGSKSGWTFIPQEVFVGGSILSLPDTLAYPTNDAGTLTVVMSWQELDYDIDLKASYGATKASTFDNPDLIESDLITPGADTGSGAGYSMTLERDVTLDTPSNLPRVETIAIDAAPGALGTASDGNGHELRFYADLFSKDDGSTYGAAEEGSLTGDDSNPPSYATMHVMYGTDHYGTWTVPLNTWEKTLHLLNIYVYASGTDSAFLVYSSGNYGDDVYYSIEEQ